MANHGPVYGLDADLARKREANYDPALEAKAKDWVQSVTGETISGDFMEALKNGVVLCNLANKLRPGIVKRVNASAMPFKQMENIGNFLTACSDFGLRACDLFQTVDLFEAKNPNQVVQTIVNLGKVSNNIAGYSGPSISF
eukprot:TRINITY_DN10718_c0_g1_i1.p1 TRINITY_DN10718_c0_g1~~TRINITY_DN10718_c0_g1_i1.p1  ORF type:complete len:141 (+),score=36.49 TRINITY_DN10718_c0_g1_i1:40-462(+)